jgi:ACS family D-galactonate transporter-like MFS transporter
VDFGPRCKRPNPPLYPKSAEICAARLHRERDPVIGTNSTKAGIGRRRWRIAWLLALGVLIGYMDRVNISVGQQALHHTFGLTTVSFGYLLGAYSWTYAMLQLPSGVLLDRFGLRRVGMVGSFIWSVATFATAASPGLVSLFSSRLLLGVGESPIFPLSAAAVSAWFPEKERGLPTAMFDAAAKFSPAIGIPFVGLLLIHFGWRFSFAFTGLLSLIYFALFARIYRNPADDPHLSTTERAHIQSNPTVQSDQRSPTATSVQASYPLGYLVRQRKVLGAMIGFATYNYSFYLLLTWLPSYAAAGLHLTPVHAVWAASVPWFFAGAIDIAVGGWLVDALIRKGHDAGIVRRRVLLLGMVCGLGIAGPAFTHHAVPALLSLCIGLGGLAAAAPVGWTLPGILVPNSSTGKVGGIMNFGSQISAIMAPVITGYLTSWTHNFAAAFALAAGLLMVGTLSYACLLGKIERIDAPLTALTAIGR